MNAASCDSFWYPQANGPSDALFVMDDTEYDKNTTNAWVPPFFRGTLDYFQTTRDSWYPFRHPSDRANGYYMGGHAGDFRPYWVTGIINYRQLWRETPHH